MSAIGTLIQRVLLYTLYLRMNTFPFTFWILFILILKRKMGRMGRPDHAKMVRLKTKSILRRGKGEIEAQPCSWQIIANREIKSDTFLALLGTSLRSSTSGHRRSNHETSTTSTTDCSGVYTGSNFLSTGKRGLLKAHSTNSLVAVQQHRCWSHGFIPHSGLCPRNASSSREAL